MNGLRIEKSQTQPSSMLGYFKITIPNKDLNYCDGNVPKAMTTHMLQYICTTLQMVTQVANTLMEKNMIRVIHISRIPQSCRTAYAKWLGQLAGGVWKEDGIMYVFYANERPPLDVIYHEVIHIIRCEHRPHFWHYHRNSSWPKDLLADEESVAWFWTYMIRELRALTLPDDNYFKTLGRIVCKCHSMAKHTVKSLGHSVQNFKLHANVQRTNVSSRHQFRKYVLDPF